MANARLTSFAEGVWVDTVPARILGMRLFEAKLFRRLAVLCMFGGAVASAAIVTPDDGADGYFFLPVEFRAGGKTVPPCTRLQVVPGSKIGKKTTLQGYGGRWRRFKVLTSLVEGRRVESFAECVAASEPASSRYPSVFVSAFSGDRVAVGMPVEFALQILGLARQDEWENKVRPDLYTWLPTEHTSAAALNYVGIRNAPTARIAGARGVRMRTGKLGEILTIVIEEDRTAEFRFSLAHGDVTDRDSRYAAGMSLYERGDHSAALEAWLPLAQEDDGPAQYSIGDLYYHGEGTEPDLDKAIRWFRKAAENFYSPAQYHLSYMYAAGEGGPRNLVEAHRWVEMADALGHPDAKTARDRIASMMTPEELDAARLLFEKHNTVVFPTLRERVAPEYPEHAQAVRAHGQVILQALVDVDGSVDSVEILRSSQPNLGFELEAVEAVMQWRFIPATIDEKPFPMYFTVVVDFTPY